MMYEVHIDLSDCLDKALAISRRSNEKCVKSVILWHPLKICLSASEGESERGVTELFMTCTDRRATRRVAILFSKGDLI